jgi:hypothetical protein
MPSLTVGGSGALYIVISGACVGFLAGLSVSPVAGALLSTVTALVVGVTSTLAGVQISKAGSDAFKSDGSRVTVSALPGALLVVGIVVGSTIGIYTRTHDWLGAHAAGRQPGKMQDAGVLYSAPTSECSDWHGIEDESALRANLIGSKTVNGIPRLLPVVESCGNKQCLEAVVELLCAR